MLNCSRELPWDVVTKHLNQFTARMQYSGYDQQFRLQVIDSALKAYEKLCKAESDGERPLYRPKTWKKKEREEARKQKRLNWYKKGGSKSVIFVPYTLNSELQKLYTEEVKRSQLPIRVVEKAGTALKRKLQRSDPFATKNCMRQECFICSSGGTGSCQVRGINYSIFCCKCEENIDEGVYHGQTSRNGFLRGEEHMDEFNKKLEKSVLWKHCRFKHNGQTEGIQFRMNVAGVYHGDPMKRQIAEAVRIQETPPNKLINDKSEYNCIQLPRASVE